MNVVRRLKSSPCLPHNNLTSTNLGPSFYLSRSRSFPSPLLCLRAEASFLADRYTNLPSPKVTKLQVRHSVICIPTQPPSTRLCLTESGLSLNQLPFLHSSGFPQPPNRHTRSDTDVEQGDGLPNRIIRTRKRLATTVTEKAAGRLRGCCFHSRDCPLLFLVYSWSQRRICFSWQ